MRWPRISFGLLLWSGLCFVLATGCRLDFTRSQTGVPLRFSEYEELVEGKTRRPEALEKLGAPDKVKWENGKSRLTWTHDDSTHLQMRLQLPISLFGYRHNIFQYFQNQEQLSMMDLVFDETGQLEQKTLRLHDAYRTDSQDSGRWRVLFTPRLEHSFLLLGDADFRDYDDIFKDGYVAGFDIGIQPVAPAIIQLGGRYQLSEGRTIPDGASQVKFDDLELFTAELSVRLQLPLRIFFTPGILENAWTLLVEDDPANFDGWIFYVEGGVGVTINDGVPVLVDGVRQGNFFDNSAGFSTSAGVGFEYSWEHFSLRTGFVYRTADGFEGGNSPFPADAGLFHSFLGMASLSVKF